MSTPLIRLVVLYGGVSAEHDVSRVSAAHVLAAADRSKYQLIPVGIDKRGAWHRNDAAAEALAAGAELPNSLDVDGPEVNPLQVLAGSPEDLTVVFPLLHGPHGEDGTVQGMLELFKLPYIGCGVLASSVCMDKAMAKEVAARAEIPQCKWLTFRDGVDDPRQILTDAADQLGFPMFVKPANMGSSVGVSRAETLEELDAAINVALRYDDVVVIEEAVVGREIEVAVLGNAAPDASLPGEVKPGSEFYDYEDKYITGAAELMIPAPLSDEAIADVRELAADAFVALRCAGLARVDFFYEEGGRGWLLNEVNTIPGFTPASMYPKMWEATGIGYSDLIDRLVTLALEVHRRRSSFSTEH
ncbi:D-alanine--D-alanine ligase family protein [Gordonia neofelifaecis]|uniref:D-alanine--D-alanine ligase n=1 Tax=Gordonia neofelifaecis NRRL B-59395 TaxID=644548 RepID=F1YPL0_9ACTN|nr:D-alanine--D-alanine ligase family protein [Gordonia neofelifaecis]EGD53355.1 D-alanine/D-alanine ligase [Gordonia neofelifaecis NRRL B-59395]